MILDPLHPWSRRHAAAAVAALVAATWTMTLTSAPCRAQSPTPAPPAPAPAAVALPVAATPSDQPAALASVDRAASGTIDLGRVPPAARAAAIAWQDAIGRKPRLVSLRAPADDAALPHLEVLRARLRMLGDKTFSNREWFNWWNRQAETATDLAAALAGPAYEPWRADLSAWAALARDKASNQDVYLAAIEAERDAIEERIEGLLDAPTEPKRAELPALVGRDAPTAFERRQVELEELEHRLEQQRTKRLAAQAEIKLLAQQLKSSAQLRAALQRDVELARREHALCADAGQRQGPLQPIFLGLAAAAAVKASKIEAEYESEADRSRSYTVESSLLDSQLGYRKDRIAALEASIASVSSVSSFLRAAWRTVADWAVRDAWRILLALLLIASLTRLALRVVGRALAAWIRRAEGDPDDSSDDDTRALTIAAVVSGVARPAIWVIGALLALEAMGINTGPLLGSAAILGLAVSFGSQNLVRDVVNGFFILMEHQYAVGEVVDIGGKIGEVERISIRSTWIRQSNGDLHVIPNGAITLVSNLTRDWSRAIVEVGVAYDSDIDTVRAISERVGAELFADPAWSERLAEAPSWVGVIALADSAVVHRIWAKVKAGDQWAVQRELNRRLKLAFDAEGIEIPFPQRVVWQRSPTDPAQGAVAADPASNAKAGIEPAA